MSDQGEVYLNYISDELDQEWKRRERLDVRGLGVLTSTSTSVTLVVALVTVLLGKDHVLQSTFSAAAGLAALLLLLVAAVLGLLAHRLRTFDVPDANGYNRLLEERWKDTETTARSTVADLRVKTLTTLRSGNNAKVRQLQCALVFQVGGVLALALAFGREVLAVLGWWA